MKYLKVIFNGSGLFRGALLLFYMGVEGGILGLILFVIFAAVGLPFFLFISLMVGSWDLIKLEWAIQELRRHEKTQWANRLGEYEDDPTLKWEVSADTKEKRIREEWFQS